MTAVMDLAVWIYDLSTWDADGRAALTVKTTESRIIQILALMFIFLVFTQIIHLKVNGEGCAIRFSVLKILLQLFEQMMDEDVSESIQWIPKVVLSFIAKTRSYHL